MPDLRDLHALLDRLAENRRRVEQLQRVRRGDRYERKRERQGVIQREQSAAGREIGPHPACADAARRESCRGDLALFCRTYLPVVFNLPWSPDHLKVIAKIERAMIAGGLFAHAMPRGSGKTVLVMAAAVWAILYGHRRYVCIIGASSERAIGIMATIASWLERNDGLFADFPEATYPIRRLERFANRCRGQTMEGRHTLMEWSADRIVFPSSPNSPSSGAVITACGMHGAEIRGQQYPTPSGEIIRPDFVILDDPQTRESATSVTQCRQREQIVLGDVLGMAGPGRKIAAILCCTVIRPGDMADTILDREKHPQWQGERTKLVYAFPTNEKLWQRYAEIRAESFRNDGDGGEATEFYRRHRDKMDEGAVVAWPERYNDDELSAIQHAMNLRLRDEAAFFAEYQNEPLIDNAAATMLSADEIAAKLNQLDRGLVPSSCDVLTAFIDVHDRLLYYAVCAWRQADFTGYVIDYGTHPDQRAHYFTLRGARLTLARAAPGAGHEGAVLRGLSLLVDRLATPAWKREDGGEQRVRRILIDAGYASELVKEFARRSEHAAMILPSYGRFVGASSIPFEEYKPVRGERAGFHWRTRWKDRQQHVLLDINYWKSFVHTRLGVALGDPSSLSLFGNSPGRHRMLAEHLTAEVAKQTESGRRKVDEWRLLPGRDNHFLDCLVGCAAAASMEGCAPPGVPATVAKREVVAMPLQTLMGR